MVEDKRRVADDFVPLHAAYIAVEKCLTAEQALCELIETCVSGAVGSPQWLLNQWYQEAKQDNLTLMYWRIKLCAEVFYHSTLPCKDDTEAGNVG